jgi:hypothetical protein
VAPSKYTLHSGVTFIIFLRPSTIVPPQVLRPGNSPYEGLSPHAFVNACTVLPFLSPFPDMILGMEPDQRVKWRCDVNWGLVLASLERIAFRNTSTNTGISASDFS